MVQLLWGAGSHEAKRRQQVIKVKEMANFILYVLKMVDHVLTGSIESRFQEQSLDNIEVNVILL